MDVQTTGLLPLAINGVALILGTGSQAQHFRDTNKGVAAVKTLTLGLAALLISTSVYAQKEVAQFV
jgi:hypothetical protein